ncbi:MAG TPA: DNA helicase [Microbacterium sp.]|uniref:DNA helicase n=1 Tax=Microbacterium sp. TaxID=51671 RepID=UPI002CDA25E1|nr:DNA helicase [Microbacterium sp.]HWI32624.1 DNA helicase [Microbacterium sp.]
MSLSRKRKKELRKLQDSANRLWDTQQVLVNEAADIAREAGRQLGHFNREQVIPTVQEKYSAHVAPVLDKTKKVIDQRIVPTVGGVFGSALSVWDAANETRQRAAAGRGFDLTPFKKVHAPVAPPARSGIGVGGVVAIVFGVAAAVGVIYAAWQTLRADDELWVADDPLRAPDA